MIRVGREYYFEFRNQLVLGRVVGTETIEVKDDKLPFCFYDVLIIDENHCEKGKVVSAISRNICVDGSDIRRKAKDAIARFEFLLRHWEEMLEMIESEPDELGSSARADIEQDLAEDREAVQPS